MNKKSITGLICAAITAMVATSCLKEGSETIVLPGIEKEIPETVIPIDLQEELSSHGFIIYPGNEPPIVDGSYLVSPVEMIYASDNYSNTAFNNLRITFTGQNPRGVIRYSESQADTVNGASLQAHIIGKGDNFTLYCLQDITSASNAWSCRTATLVSGTKKNNGIQNIHYAFVMLESASTSTNGISPLAPSGTVRVFCDGDNLATKLN